ncbi:PH domain-containing protein [Psychrosphaera aquimarina]|uniref:PH domain-containing protein n=1 Tax=Psychrosphaera aquimarina TaxID=2044854 RepID=A0ABU3R0V2_9GAMM|nr:PH domain-containing protein [Psychrosphaera aquimarina]MDU0113308.1 PH domain-containing protein [Psychrosphaera aquimarina]
MFKSKVDKSIVVILIASFSFAFFALFSEINRPDLYSSLLFLLNESSESSESRSALLVLMLTTFFVVFIFVKVKYQVTDTQIIIHNGLFNKTIAIKDVRKVTHTINLISAAALSRKRLVLHYFDKDQGERQIQISPKDRKGFLAAIDKPLSDSL